MTTERKETTAEACARMNAPYPKGSERYVMKHGRIVDLLGHGQKTRQLTVQFASAAKRYVEASERGDLREVLAIGLQVTEAMERLVRHMSFTEVAT
jgi:hypothetical protein